MFYLMVSEGSVFGGLGITVAGSCGIRERVAKKQIKGWATLKQSKGVLLHASVFRASAISLSYCNKAILLIPYWKQCMIKSVLII